MIQRASRWLYDHPLAISWFCVAWCSAFAIYDLIHREWFAFAIIGAASLVNVYVIWSTRRRIRRIDAEIRRMEEAARERLERRRADRGARYTHTPEEP